MRVKIERFIAGSLLAMLWRDGRASSPSGLNK